MKTIGSVLDGYKGIGPGFDFLRVALAITIVLHHSFLTVEGDYHTVAQYNLWPFLNLPVPMFFALSGFLVSGSALRLKLRDFLMNRALRIVPALAVDICLSALLIGPMVTALPLHDYFMDRHFFHYLLNIVGFIHYELPGVFTLNPFPDIVNGSVWTVPLEIGSYTIMSCLMLTGTIKTKPKLIAAAVVFVVLYLCLFYYYADRPSLLDSMGNAGHYLSNFISERGSYLYFYFLAGALLYAFRYQVPFSGRLALLAAASYLLIYTCGLLSLNSTAPLALALPVSYMMAYIGLSPVKKLPVYSRGDYSYGIYLYAYPLQQVLVLLFPGQFSVFTHFILSTALVTCVAMFSWHCIEKPILHSRKKYSFTARKGDHDLALPMDETVKAS